MKTMTGLPCLSTPAQENIAFGDQTQGRVLFAPQVQGWRLTLLDATFKQYFGFVQTSLKHQCPGFFFKALLSKACDET